MALTTLSGVNAYKEWTLGENAARDALIPSLINSISAQFETYCDRKFNSTSYTEYYDGENRSYLYTNQYPIISVASVNDDTTWTWNSSTVITGTSYRVSSNSRSIILKNLRFYYANENVKVVYTAGYATIPGDLELACIEEVADQWKDSTKTLGTIKSRTLPDGSVTYGDGGGSASTPPFRPTIMDTLDRYRNKHIV